MPKPLHELAKSGLGAPYVTPHPAPGLGLALDHNGLAPTGALGSGDADDTVFLRGDGSWAQAGNTVYRKTTAKDVANTTTETDLLNSEIEIAAGVMGTDKAAKLTLWGDYLNNTGGTPTTQLKIKFGGTTLLDVTTGGVGASASRRAWFIEFTIQNVTAASQISGGRASLGLPTAAATGTGSLANAEYVGGPLQGAASTVDTAAAVAVAVTATHSTASASLSWRLNGALLEIT